MHKGSAIVLLLLLSLPMAEAGMINITHYETQGFEGSKVKARFRYHNAVNNSLQEGLKKISTILYCQDLQPTAFETIEFPTKDDVTDEYLVGVKIPKGAIPKESSRITCTVHIEAGDDTAFIENIEIKRSWKSIPSRLAQWIEDGWKAIKEAFSGRRAVNDFD